MIDLTNLCEQSSESVCESEDFNYSYLAIIITSQKFCLLLLLLFLLSIGSRTFLGPRPSTSLSSKKCLPPLEPLYSLFSCNGTYY